jgi:polyisoprenyl-phosphate glycosyltransferase
MSRPQISLVVPVYNEEKILSELTLRISKVIEELPQFEWEVIYVDDGSSDGSSTELQSLTRKHSWLRVLYLSRNFGHQTAITAGTDYASGDAVILMDGDLQDPPELIPQMLDTWQHGFDVVSARRKQRNGESWFKLTTAFLFYRMLRLLSDVEIPVDTGDFRLMSRPVVEALKRMPERSRFLRGMVSWTGFRQTEIEYERSQRLEGATKYTLSKMLRLAANGILSFSRAPLQAITAAGIFFTACSFAGIIGLLYQAFFLNKSLAGWSSLITCLLFTGGVQMLCLGILGSYIGRIFDEVRGRPLYFIREIQSQGVMDQNLISFPRINNNAGERIHSVL